MGLKALLNTGTVVDRYVVESPLGAGGVASVYAVRHQELGSLHALKVLLIHAPALAERALQEGRIQASLRHRNVVPVTDVVRYNGSPALVMELVDGPGLDLYISKLLEPLPIDKCDALARGILSGVIAAHDRDLIHRDLKPGNVLLAQEDGEVVPKVADFGLAKLLGDGGLNKSRTGVMMGTPAYMAPEQFRDAKSVGPRADVFALGCILYELVCGIPPYGGLDVIDLFQSIQAESYTPPHELREDLPNRMRNAIRGALVSNEAERIEDVRTLLRTWVGGTSAPANVWTAQELEEIRCMGPLGGRATVDMTPTPVRDDSLTTTPFMFDPDEIADDPDVESVLPSDESTPHGTMVPPSEALVPVPAAPPQPAPQRVADDISLPPLEHEPEKRDRPMGMILLGAAALVLALGGVWWGLQRPTADTDDPAPADVEPTNPEPEAPPDPEPPIDPEPQPVDPQPVTNPQPSDPPPRVDPEPVAQPDPEPEPEPVAEPEPQPVAATGTRIDVSGGGRAFLLDGTGKRFEPGAVPAGSYSLHVFFDEARPTKVLDVSVGEGQQRTLACNTAMRSCR